VITSLGGDPVDGPEELVAAITARQPGDVVEVVLQRDGETLTVTATLGAHDEVTS
jgi:S1-C subfamily serine protease